MLTTQPLDRLRLSRFEVEYLRPWPGLPVQEGRVAAGLPVHRSCWVGVSVAAGEAGGVARLRLGAWVGLQPWLRAELAWHELRVGELTTRSSIQGEADLALRRQDWAVGAWFQYEGSEVRALLRRGFWVNYSVGRTSAFLLRRSQPWTGLPQLEAGAGLGLGTRLRAALRYGPSGAELTLGWTVSGMALLSSTVWSGARSGAFGLRVAERR